jgi:acyl carrier protein
VINLAGEALPELLVAHIRDLWPRVTVCNLYGPTEDTTYSTWLRLPPGDGSAVTIGRPLPGTQLYLLDQHMLPVPPGAHGEIFLAGNGLARGYLDRPVLTAERFVPDPLAVAPGRRMYRTGDLGRLRPDGSVEYLGRGDDQVKIRGHRIELGTIDAALNHVPEVAAAAVVAHSEPLRLTAFYCAAGAGGESLERTLRSTLTDQLPRYMVPASFRRLDALPLTPNGKIDRRALRVLAASAPAAVAPLERQAPRNALETDVLQRFAQYLGCAPEAIGIDDDFFLLGGHSLLATRLMFDLNQHWHCELRLADLMSRPSVAELAEKLLAGLAHGTDDLAELVSGIDDDPVAADDDADRQIKA